MSKAKANGQRRKVKVALRSEDATRSRKKITYHYLGKVGNKKKHCKNKVGWSENQLGRASKEGSCRRAYRGDGINLLCLHGQAASESTQVIHLVHWFRCVTTLHQQVRLVHEAYCLFLQRFSGLWWWGRVSSSWQRECANFFLRENVDFPLCVLCARHGA